MSDEQFSNEIRIRFSECDAQGIVFNANWFMYMDVTMTEFWRNVIGGYEHLPKSLGVETVVAETGGRFRGAARFDDILTFTPRVLRIGTSSMRVEIDAFRDEELLFEGFLEYVFVRANELSPVPIPEQIREMLPVQDPSGPATV